ncbi:MAG: Txe/YoeB family addiction module toxin [Thermoanaerobaculia bacterium]|nr:Txe/YoeB family addiction module toxin [Thermoanaerobaculia bacterium]
MAPEVPVEGRVAPRAEGGEGGFVKRSHVVPSSRILPRAARSGGSRDRARPGRLVEAGHDDPFRAPSKPEPLEFPPRGCRSRRITQEHRLVYLVRQDRLDFLPARYVYRGGEPASPSAGYSNERFG